jgi:hypothetical protein
MVLAAAARVAETVKLPWHCGSKGVLIPQLGHDVNRLPNLTLDWTAPLGPDRLRLVI